MDQDGDGDQEWYSTIAGDEKDLLLSAEVDLSAYPDPILSFDTYYEIESTWDFGFIQVSTDGGTTWTSLENAYTTTEFADGGYPAIYDNLPGLTGSSGGWVNMEFDLTAYASSSEPILIGFRYMTDWAENEAGWYIDNIAIGGVVIEDGDTTNLFIGPDPEQTDFIVTLIGVNIIGGEEFYTQVTTLELDELTEETLSSISLNEYVTADEGYVLLVVSTNKGLVDYSFSVQRG